LRRTYYDLCCARKAFLHERLSKQVSSEFSVAVILETIKIADGIRASSLASLEVLVGWKKALESFKLMGMDVGFMCKRVEDLIGLLTALSLERERYEEVKLEQARIAKQIRALESKLSVLKDTLKDVDLKMEEMVDTSTKGKDQAMQKLATAPW
jgi:hypothetical protein